MNLQIWTIVLNHSLSIPTSCKPHILCGCLSGRQCGCLILIKKNDKCGGKIKFCDIQLLAWNMVPDKNKWQDLDLLSEWYMHIINFYKKQNVWIDAAHFLRCRRLSPVTSARNVPPRPVNASPQPIYFKCTTGNSSKYYTNQKSLGDSSVTCRKDESASNRWYLAAAVLESLSPQTKCTLGIIMTRVWKCICFVCKPLSLMLGAVSRCYLDDSSNKLSFPSFWCAAFLSSSCESPFQISLSKIFIWANKMKSGWRHS